VPKSSAVRENKIKEAAKSSGTRAVPKSSAVRENKIKEAAKSSGTRAVPKSSAVRENKIKEAAKSKQACPCPCPKGKSGGTRAVPKSSAGRENKIKEAAKSSGTQAAHTGPSKGQSSGTQAVYTGHAKGKSRRLLMTMQGSDEIVPEGTEGDLLMAATSHLSIEARQKSAYARSKENRSKMGGATYSKLFDYECTGGTETRLCQGTGYSDGVTSGHSVETKQCSVFDCAKKAKAMGIDYFSISPAGRCYAETKCDKSSSSSYSGYKIVPRQW